METAVQPPASYSGRDPCLDQAGPSGCAKKIPKRQPLDTSANNNNNRKRRGSFGNAHDKSKRRRRNDIVLPTKFMLGGNITDPLNLRSLENEEVNRLANQTPVASPAPAAGGGSERVEVIIPQNINDPLNLNGPDVIRPPPAPVRKDRRIRKRYRNDRRRVQRVTSQNVEAAPKTREAVAEGKNGSNTTNNNNNPGGGGGDNINRNPRSNSNNNPRNSNGNNNSRSSNGSNNSRNSNGSNGYSNNSKKNNQTQKFRFGNYNRYYGYRNSNGTDDSRLGLFKKEWFFDKSCLDIGCNVGHVTLSIARDHQPKQMIGLDIDPDLVKIAKRNVRNYLHQKDTSGRWFPASCPLTFGPIAISGAQAGFPHNIFFVSGNYVLEKEEMLETQKEEFDTIICLSTTKWMQLNFGDEGLKRVFRRVFRQLKPGGRFILEPQPITSYKKKVAPEHWENFNRMELMPEMYPDFLINEVGFASYEVLGVGSHAAKGFQRPLYLFRKAKPEAVATPETGSEPPGPSPAHECDTTTASI